MIEEINFSAPMAEPNRIEMRKKMEEGRRKKEKEKERKRIKKRL